MKYILITLIAICCVFSINNSTSAETIQTDVYRVGINDVIDITVIGHPDLGVSTAVAVDGTISFPHLGNVYIKDFTLEEIKELVTNKLSDGFVKFPVVSVALRMTKSKMIFLNGEVVKIGAIPFEKDITVIKALSFAGGIRVDGLYGKLKIRRGQEKSAGYQTLVEEEINNGIIKNKKVEDLVLQPDDILIIERNKTFLIQGEVGKRGRIVLEKDMTVLRALLEAGGVSPDGLYGTIKIRRKKEGTTGDYKELVESKLRDGIIENREVEDMILHPDDILIVERNKTFLMQGEVRMRGRIVLEKDMTVLRALLEAGGVSPDGLYGTIKIRRKQEGDTGKYRDFAESKLNDGVVQNSEIENMLIQPDDILIVERNKTFLIQGEVGKRGRLILENDMSVLRALLEAGGVSHDGFYGTLKIRRKDEGKIGEYRDLVESKLNNGVIEDSEVEDLILYPDDVLIVERNKTFFIYGEVNNTGEFVYKSDMTVFKAITNAGGFTKWGSASRVKILRKNESNKGFDIIKVNIKEVLKGDASADVFLEPDDTLVISTGIF